MSLRIYIGLPGTGKTSDMFAEMTGRRCRGDRVVLFFSAEHEELTRRSNIVPGGMAACRIPGQTYRIDHVVRTAEACRIVGELGAGTLAVFDEAQYFYPEIVDAWCSASGRGVDVLVATPSHAQWQALSSVDYQVRRFELDCPCAQRKATRVLYERDLAFPTHLCDQCHAEQMQREIDDLLTEVVAARPFPGELRTYQPFYNLPVKDLQVVRGDSPQRLEILQAAALRSPRVKALLDDPVAQPSFIDLGCCSGFFCDGMETMGFRSSGVDVDRHFISWAERLARLKGQRIHYTQSDLLKYLTSGGATFDVVSSFATIQWLMDQQGYEAGLSCFREMCEKAGALCVVEMGYTAEPIYRDKIVDRPAEIDRGRVLDMMAKFGDFAEIEVHPAGEHGIWRDVFVGFRQRPIGGSHASEPQQQRYGNQAEVPGGRRRYGAWSKHWRNVRRALVRDRTR